LQQLEALELHCIITVHQLECFNHQRGGVLLEQEGHGEWVVLRRAGEEENRWGEHFGVRGVAFHALQRRVDPMHLAHILQPLLIRG